MNQIVITSGPIAGIGHNQPPDEPVVKAPTPFELSKAEIDGLYMESKNWADGSKVETQEQADAIGKLIALIRTAETTADERRKAENKTFDDGKAEVQARYAELIADTKSKKGMTVLALDALKTALTPFLLAEEARKQKIAADAAAEAKLLQDEATAAVRTAAGTGNLEAQETAETLLNSAKKAGTVATKAANDKPQAKGIGRAIGLRTVYRPEISNLREFAKYCWETHPTDVAELWAALAVTLVNRSIRTIPGVIIHEEKVV